VNSGNTSDLFLLPKVPKPWLVDTSRMKKGIDNYHVDVKISSRFNAALKKLITSLLDEATSSPAGKPVNNFREFDALKSAYLDIMTGLIHRIKTDLSINEIHLLESALVKQVLELVRAQLDELINSERTRANAFRERGSTEALDANHRSVSLQRNYDSILFKVNQQIFTEMRRIDARHSAPLREKFLSTPDNDAVDALFSPMLLTSNLSTPTLLIEQYRLWDTQGGERADMAFNKLNLELEQLLEKELPEFPMLNLRIEQEAGAPELFDSLGGLLQTQKFMGLAVNQKALIREEFCWFDNPDNVRELFSAEHYPALLLAARKQEGFRAWWSMRKQTRRFKKTLQHTAKLMRQTGLLKPLIASQQVAKIWNSSLAERLDAKFLCQYFSGQITIRKLLERCASKKPLSEQQVKQLVKAAEEVDRQARSDAVQHAFLILEDVSRFRQHLKQYRFAHRLFNRLRILKHAEEINLSKQSGSLYTLLTANEREDNDARIAHHAILKAHVRGSTTVTEELQNRGLNPASHFSLRFFSPVNQMLPTYSATKVSIDGDAVILSFLEYEQMPQQWFCVARACGLALEMLNIIHASNRYSEQMDLPPLELGIGICYVPTPPRFLYDNDEPIMISAAIGTADRLSSCASNLRTKIATSPFNVDVFSPAEGMEGGEKLIHNMNGILLDNIAFEKLQAEISLKQLQLFVNDKSTILYIGKFPDNEGKSHDLVIREGHIGMWPENTAEASLTKHCYYEVVSNHKLITEALG